MRLLANFAVSALLFSACGTDGHKPPAASPAQGMSPATTSGTRLVAVILKSPDGASISTGRFFDNVLQEQCALRPMNADETLIQCVPVKAIAWQGEFVDPACTMFGVHSDTPDNYIAHDNHDSDGTFSSRSVVSANSVQGPLYRLIGGVCQTIQLPAGAMLYQEGIPVDLVTFNEQW